LFNKITFLYPAKILDFSAKSFFPYNVTFYQNVSKVSKNRYMILCTILKPIIRIIASIFRP